MTCKFCDERWARFWAFNDDWEREHSNDSDIFAQETDHNRALIQQADALADSDPAAAFRTYVNAAELGSIWSLAAVGWRYWTGTGVAVDLQQAQNYYRRAADAGYWMAHIHLARLLAELQQYDEAELVLEKGMASDFAPAFYWLARLRCDRLQSRKVATEIRPLLERADREGHPGAQLLLAKMALTGKFGLHEIPRGMILAFGAVCRFVTET